jgi:probable HAF family extracellular repeat protein
MKEAGCHRVSLAVIAIVLGLQNGGSHCCGASFTGLNDPQGPGGGIYDTGASDVSADGNIVVGGGRSYSLGYIPIYWTRQSGVVVIPPVLGIPYDFDGATAISGDGSAIVGYMGGYYGPRVAFRWTAAEGSVPLGYLPGGTGSSGADVSADGSTIVGSANDSAGGVSFIWTKAGGMQALGRLTDHPYYSVGEGASAISADGSVVVGGANSPWDPSPYQAYRWTAAEGMVGMGDLPGNVATSIASDVSADGSVIVGTGQTFALLFVGQGEAFRWTAATGMLGLGDLPGGIVYSEGHATSADGSVVVGMSYSSTDETAFRWTQARGMESVLDLLVESGVDMTGWKLRGASSVSADGQVIVGYGINPSGYGEGWLADFRNAPEPSASWLFLLAIVGGFALIRRSAFRAT